MPTTTQTKSTNLSGYCGNSFTAGSVPTAAGDCSFNCPGNALEKCGAGNRLSVWSFGAIPSSSSVTQTSATGSTTVTSTSSISTAIPTGWEYRGCYVEGTSGRILTHQSPDMVAPNGLTLQKCIAYCTGYTIVGLEFGQQCFCDNAIHNGGTLAASDSDCSVPCAGDSTRKCGGGNRVRLSFLSKISQMVFLIRFSGFTLLDRRAAGLSTSCTTEGRFASQLEIRWLPSVIPSFTSWHPVELTLSQG